MKTPSKKKKQKSGSTQSQQTSTQKTTIGTPNFGYVAYENKNYKLVVGIPPTEKDYPNPGSAYLTINKETGVTESWHSSLFHAKQHTDFLDDLLEGKARAPFGITEVSAADLFSDALPGLERKGKAN